MSASVYFMKRVKDCKDWFIMSLRKVNSDDGQVYSVCILQFSCFTKYNRIWSHNINKQNVKIADETLTDYSFLSRYHYTRSKNYLKRQYRIRHWIPMFIGTPCTSRNQALTENILILKFKLLVKNFVIPKSEILCCKSCNQALISVLRRLTD